MYEYIWYSAETSEIKLNTHQHVESFSFSNARNKGEQMWAQSFVAMLELSLFGLHLSHWIHHFGTWSCYDISPQCVSATVYQNLRCRALACCQCGRCVGLYGICRPYDDVKPVRDIPMNAKIKTKKGALPDDVENAAVCLRFCSAAQVCTSPNSGVTPSPSSTSAERILWVLSCRTMSRGCARIWSPSVRATKGDMFFWWSHRLRRHADWHADVPNLSLFLSLLYLSLSLPWDLFLCLSESIPSILWDSGAEKANRYI